MKKDYVTNFLKDEKKDYVKIFIIKICIKSIKFFIV